MMAVSPSLERGRRPAARRDDAPSGSDDQSRRFLIVGRLALLLAVLGVWEIASLRFDLELQFSRPSLVFVRLIEFVGSGEFYRNLGLTLAETLIGFLIGTVSGLAFGAAMGSFRTFGRLVDPFVHFLNSVPRVALAPLLVFAIGFGLWSKVAVIVTIIFFVMVTSADAGIRNVDRDLILAARILGATRMQLLRTILAPSTLVWLFPALRLSIAYSFLGVVIGEFVGATAGLGFYILRSANGLDTTGVVAAITVMAFLSVAAIALLGLLERRVLRWQPTSAVLG